MSETPPEDEAMEIFQAETPDIKPGMFVSGW